jgi:hypothetical protein
VFAWCSEQQDIEGIEDRGAETFLASKLLGVDGLISVEACPGLAMEVEKFRMGLYPSSVSGQRASHPDILKSSHHSGWIIFVRVPEKCKRVSYRWHLSNVGMTQSHCRMRV